MLDFFLWIASALVRWIRLKHYQYEVTFAVYMLTPTEKFIFNSIILTTVTMIVTGAYIYLPNHIRTVCGHMYYYLVGDRTFLSSNFPSITSVFGETATQKLGVIYETAKNTAATTTESIAEL
ncbi:serine palmitoyltransferase small subunit family protein [Aspergillus ruber CBS 135680]|uniref:Serine palmitoyltransferase small subunit B n=1 Tax=Aspergillus ruber (strain CBS 135680) TaxID=1388766 RepID=A0A017SIV2_ASPRC|nr:uncharacterized protein EURHEDRAFT_451988 [Aspergillus ruber CBS 135680]EYE96681.1 hypothetical protein EURHEDRAFT_451988 [Aspergillus ruber CBS 135680]